MNNWPHEKISNNLRWEIGKSTMDPHEWKFTRISDHHPEAISRINTSKREQVLVTAVFSPDSWYALTSQRVIGCYEAKEFDIEACTISRFMTGTDPKGKRGTNSEMSILLQRDGSKYAMQYETGKAWMAPENYFRWWVRKYPILDVFKFDPNPDPAG